jgi:hypothetical protein
MQADCWDGWARGAVQKATTIILRGEKKKKKKKKKKRVNCSGRGGGQS